jgi:Ser/Thr protein kinase RdoA (MazF antagonist)
MEKKRIIKSYENLSPELQEILKEKYKYGYSNQIVRLSNAKNEIFFAVPLETEEANYMVKVQPEKIKKTANSKEDYFSNEDEDHDNNDFESDNADETNDPSYEPNYDDVA